MFTQTSMTGAGLAVIILTTILNSFGIVPAIGQVDEIVGHILNIVSDCAVVVGWILTIWGQIRRADLKMGLWRK